MSQVYQLLSRLNYKNHQRCHHILTEVVHLAVESYPDFPSLKALEEGAAARLGEDVTRPCVSRAVCRAILDIWYYGDRELLIRIYGRTLLECPTSKNFVYTIANYLVIHSLPQIHQEHADRAYRLLALSPEGKVVTLPLPDQFNTQS